MITHILGFKHVVIRKEFRFFPQHPFFDYNMFNMNTM